VWFSQPRLSCLDQKFHAHQMNSIEPSSDEHDFVIR